ncbi:MAG: sodium:solute symporter family protein [Acidobacteria bacterium]|nr:sodium:solute symporter family protein [Acidobacteriota bacterium]
MSTALVIAIAYFLILSIGVSFWLKRKVKSGADFVTGSGSLSWPLVAACFVLAPLGSGHTLSLWEGSAGMGASVLWWGMMSGGVFVPLFLLWFGPWFRRLNVQTFPEGMGKMFGARIGWLISAVFPAQLIGICIAEVMATATALFALSGGSRGPLDMFPDCILLAVILTILYIIAAGLMQVAWMNLVNAIMLIAGSFIAVFFTGSWLSDRGGWQYVSDFYADAGTAWKTSILNFSPDIIFTLIFPCLILTLFMQSASQAQNQPMLAARSESDVRRGVFWASFVNSLAAYPWVILALVGMSIPAIAVGGAKLAVPGLALEAFPGWLVGLLMISLLSATLSTTAILILAASHIMVNDIFKGVLNPKMKDKTFLALTRMMIFICTILVIIPALRDPEILPLLYWIFSFAIPVFGVYLIGMLWKVNKIAAWTTILAGYAAAFVWTFAAPHWLPDYLSLNVYPTTFATLFFGIVLNLILPGKPGYLRQMKRATERTDAGAAAATTH